MAQTTNVSGTPTRADDTSRTTKQSDSVHPYYFSSFQSYCTSPKANAPPKSQNKDQLSIPEHIKVEADTMLSFINSFIIERLTELTRYTTTVPIDFIQQKGDTPIHRYLIDRAMVRTMDDGKVINWMTSFKKLYPVRTSGNGNCLLHAVLIAIAGIHDFNLYLRDRLTQFMDGNQKVLKEQWRIQRLKSDKTYGILSEDSELDSEWQELCDLVRYENSEDGQTATSLQFLEAVHIFSISNMLRRPIIVFSEDVVRNKHGEAISVNDLLGIYLPVLSPPYECVRDPIVLAFDRSHFCPLQTCDDEYGISPRSGRKLQLNNLLPLYQSLDQAYQQNLLPVHFLGNDVTKEQTMKLLQEYLQIEKLNIRSESDLMDVPVVCARLGEKRLGLRDNFFMLYRKYVIDFFETQKREMQKKEEQEQERERERQRQSTQDYYGSVHRSYTTDPRTGATTYSSSPPPPYSTVVKQPNSNTLPSRNSNNLIYERRSSYEDAVANGSDLMPKPITISGGGSTRLHTPQKSQKSPEYAQMTQRERDQNGTNNHYDDERPTYDERVNENYKSTNGYPANGVKIINNNNDSSPRDSGSAIRREAQNVTNIPIQYANPSFLSNNSNSSQKNLIDLDPATTRIRSCILCRQSFFDSTYTGFCPECEFKNNHPSTYYTMPSFPRNHITAIQVHRPNSDFATPIRRSPRTTITTRRPMIWCPNCKQMNMINNALKGTDFNCSVCGAALRIN